MSFGPSVRVERRLFDSKRRRGRASSSCVRHNAQPMALVEAEASTSRCAKSGETMLEVEAPGMLRNAESRHRLRARRGHILLLGAASVAVAVVLLCSTQRTHSGSSDLSVLLSFHANPMQTTKMKDSIKFTDLKGGASTGGAGNTVAGTGQGAGGPGDGAGPGNGAGQGLGPNGGGHSPSGGAGSPSPASGGASTGGAGNTVAGSGHDDDGAGDDDDNLSTSPPVSPAPSSSNSNSFNLKPYADSYNVERSSYLEKAATLNERKIQYQVAREAYVAGTSTFTKGLFDGVPDFHGDEFCDGSRRRRYMLRKKDDSSDYHRRARRICRRMRKRIRSVAGTVDPAVGQANQ